MAKKILVADDEQEICEFIEHVLSEIGYTVVCVNDGQQAFDKISQEQFDLAIIDVMMPKIDGYHLVYKINTDINGIVPKIIILSSRDQKADSGLGTKSGAQVQLSKPTDPKNLIMKVEELIGPA